MKYNVALKIYPNLDDTASLVFSRIAPIAIGIQINGPPRGIIVPKGLPELIEYDFKKKTAIRTEIPPCRNGTEVRAVTIGVRPDGRILALGVKSSSAEEIKTQGADTIFYQLFTITLKGKKIAAEVTTIPIPARRSYHAEVVLSHDGRRLLWAFTDHVGSDHVLTLYLSSLDGRQMRKWITKKADKDSESGNQDNPIYSFAWTPDDRYITFVEKDVLYKVPVPKE